MQNTKLPLTVINAENKKKLFQLPAKGNHVFRTGILDIVGENTLNTKQNYQIISWNSSCFLPTAYALNDLLDMPQ